MRTTHNFQPAVSAPLLFDISSLVWLRQQESAHFQTGNGWAQYTVVLVEGNADRAGEPQPLPSALYFGRAGGPTMAAVPAQVRGQVLRFTDEFVGLAGHDRELLLFQLFHRGPAGPVLVPEEQALDLAQLLGSMKRQAAGAALLREDLLRSYLKTLLLYCTRLLQQQLGAASPVVVPGLVGRFQLLLEAQYKSWKSVTEYAEHLHVTANHLSVSIKRETGRPASEHIHRRIVLEAKRLVSLGDVPLKEVAYQLGFEDVSHFSKLFKRCTGVTFSFFKEQRRAQYRCCPAGLVLA